MFEGVVVIWVLCTGSKMMARVCGTIVPKKGAASGCWKRWLRLQPTWSRGRHLTWDLVEFAPLSTPEDVPKRPC